MADVRYAAGTFIFRAGDPGDRAYRLEAGQVELLAGPAEAPVRAVVLGPGDVFGEMSLIEERPRSMSARAVTDSAASLMTRDEFERLLTADPARTRQYLRSLFERLRTLAAHADVAEPPAVARAAALAAGADDEELPEALPVGPVDLPTAPDFGVAAGLAVVVHPLTRRAAETLPDDGLRVTRFPLRVGRAADAAEADAFDLNDLWLLDTKPYHVSKNHFAVELDGRGAVVRDRGSSRGCVVNEQHIGGRSPFRTARLALGDNVLVVGGRLSPYQFRLTVEVAE